MKNELENQLMEDPDIEDFLKSAILEKAREHDRVSEIINACSDADIDQILSDSCTEENISLILKRFEADKEIKRIEIDLARMCYSLSSTKDCKYEMTDWQRAYEYATRYARIEDVVRLLIGEEKFNRNIRCCFHEDKRPSLKVYMKNNRFVCFGCGIRGSPIDFVMQYKNCSFRQAVLFISNLT